MPLTVKVDGADGLARRLGSAARTAEAAIRRRLLAAAHETARAAAARVRDQRDAARPLPSRLAESLAVHEDGAMVVVAANAPYAVFVELGTARTAAEPFLGPAFADMTARLAAALPHGGAAS